PTSSEQI
nr:Chain I, Bax Peptide [synthetic construct]2G5B_J Chain J, Bax Peptide [synthetic construct]2G5B_K Chain K, Bax Peptide [synthetic construct]2G5B_L Chain L, Bax Peptide [synthetic construct]